MRCAAFCGANSLDPRGSPFAARGAACPALDSRLRPDRERPRDTRSSNTESNMASPRSVGDHRAPVDGGRWTPHRASSSRAGRCLTAVRSTASSRCYATGRRYRDPWLSADHRTGVQVQHGVAAQPGEITGCRWAVARPVTCAPQPPQPTRRDSSPAFAPPPTGLTLARRLPGRVSFFFDRRRGGDGSIGAGSLVAVAASAPMRPSLSDTVRTVAMQSRVPDGPTARQVVRIPESVRSESRSRIWSGLTFPTFMRGRSRRSNEVISTRTSRYGSGNKLHILKYRRNRLCEPVSSRRVVT
jgi:hypothetical protein